MDVTLHLTAMGLRIGVLNDGQGTIKGTGVSIGDFSRRFAQWEYDRVDRRYVLKGEYFYYDEKQEVLYLPRFCFDELKLWLAQKGLNGVTVNVPAVTPSPAPFFMLPHIQFKNEKQKTAFEFLTNPDTGPLRGLALQTGVGKTVALIMAIQKMAVRSMVTMTSRLEQWVREMQAYTTLEPDDDIYIIQGVGSLTKLFDQIDKKIFPKVILASSRTIRLYMDYGPTYQHLPHPSEMCEKLGIGVVATDEYHEHFYTNYLIGIMLNSPVMVPITATFVASDPFVSKIFNQFVPKPLQFVGGEYDKYVNITGYVYKSGGHLIKPYTYTARGAYSQVALETFLMSNRGRPVLNALVADAIIPIIKDHYIALAEKGERFLFLCATKKLCDHLEGVFRREFSDKKVSVFYSGMPETILSSYDMILSTPGSSGTGRDIKNLRTCFAFESTNSESRNLQFLGRLRGPPQMLNTPEFTYLSFACIPQHQRYAQFRSVLYGPRAKQIRQRVIQ